MTHVVIYTPHWKIGGIERVIQHLIAGLQPKGYRFSIVTEDTPNPDHQFDLGPDVPVYFRSFAPFSEQNEAAMRRLLLRINPDIALAMGSSRALYKVPRSLMDTDIPVILSEHNSTSKLRLAFDASSDFLNGTRSYADFVHVLMDEYGLDALEPERIRVIGNPVFPQVRRANVASRLPGDPRGNVILSAARYDPNQKQPDLLIKAFALIADRNPDWRVEFHGDDWKGNKAHLEALVAE
ncbi:MAG TPA: glycosyltransferase, partial [Tepidisphaeraceae bacterium]|nr:glycosyltransferase [Tepidisphaeraceae bacterium]